MYKHPSMLRTMEHLLGLRPMTHFDAGARVMTAASAIVLTPPRTPRKSRASRSTERNPAATPAAQRAENLRLDEADDENDDDEMNDMLWRAIARMRRPRRCVAFSADDAITTLSAACAGLPVRQ